MRIIVPACLALMMVGLGMTLVVDDFRRVLVYPKAGTVGLAFQMILLPAVGFGLANLFPLMPKIAVGLMLIACCPGGVASNVITHLAKGDTALAVTLTVISSSLSIITIPVIVNLSLVHFVGPHSPVELPLLETVLKVFALTIPTIITGMVLKAKTPRFAERSRKIVDIGGLLFLIVIIIAVAAQEKDLIVNESLKVGPVTITLCLSTMLLGYFGAKLFKINHERSIAIAIATGFQNSALALVIATSFMEDAAIAIPPAIYTVVMWLADFAVVAIRNLINKKKGTEA